jgi:hypothetical protein
MKKFWTVVLKIVMFLSFAGIIVFSCIAVISSNNITYEAYNYLNTNMSSLGLEEFTTKVNNDILTSHGGTKNSYVSCLSSFILDTKNTFNYYLDYLALDDIISKGEQNVIIEDFKSCVKAKEECETIYSYYMDAYGKASAGLQIAEDYVTTYERSFLNNYAELYRNLVNLQCDLYKATKINIVKVESFDFQKYIVMSGLSNFAVDNLYNEENLKKASTNRISISSFTAYTTYNSYKTKIASYNNQKMASNTSLQKYVYDLNSLDIFSWAKNYDDYLLTLNNTLREKAIDARSFFNASLI